MGWECNQRSDQRRIPAYLVRLGLQDVYGESGPPEELLDKYGMGVEDIVCAAKKAVEHKIV